MTRAAQPSRSLEALGILMLPKQPILRRDLLPHRAQGTRRVRDRRDCRLEHARVRALFFLAQIIARESDTSPVGATRNRGARGRRHPGHRDPRPDGLRARAHPVLSPTRASRNAAPARLRRPTRSAPHGCAPMRSTIHARPRSPACSASYAEVRAAFVRASHNDAARDNEQLNDTDIGAPERNVGSCRGTVPRNAPTHHRGQPDERVERHVRYERRRALCVRVHACHPRSSCCSAGMALLGMAAVGFQLGLRTTRTGPYRSILTVLWTVAADPDLRSRLPARRRSPHQHRDL